MGSGPHQHHHHSPLFFSKPKLSTRSIFFLTVSLALLNLYLFFPSHRPSQTTALPSPSPPLVGAVAEPPRRRCNYADGRWLPDPCDPLYDDATCATIKEGRNCISHGRPDSGYLHWRWEPRGCRLRRFDAAAFLCLIAGKHLAFVGDSLARNQLESLLCLLSGASAPELVHRNGEDDKFRRWVFQSHNATVSIFWSPFLVEGVEKSPEEGRLHNHLYLDSPDPSWSSELAGIDVVVFSGGHWFLHPGVFHQGGAVVGCHHCPDKNQTETGFFDAFRKAVRTALTAARAAAAENLAVVTTFSPAHFEGEWDKAGACSRTEPYVDGEREMEYTVEEMRRIGVEAAAAAAVTLEGRRRVRVEAMDVTKMAMMRPDGHPGPYMRRNPFAGGGRRGEERVQNDCVHWCLPGPIDAWNEVLFDVIGRWRGGWE
ncbi:hypothetical protein AXF42_Ash016363 [Apostasia shenzhenica]|uniref:Uncharacterized protein n=1 Tax=Apostasia shenzhenica TaxID=1088818 RepID=A0A2H9ZZZ9_9ASPA|nr:hypothetical protein AXF42_Ash016363 [Apostasia shenzhenica]